MGTGGRGNGHRIRINFVLRYDIDPAQNPTQNKCDRVINVCQWGDYRYMEVIDTTLSRNIITVFFQTKQSLYSGTVVSNKIRVSYVVYYH